MSQVALYHSTSVWTLLSIAKSLIQKMSGFTWMTAPMVRVPNVAISQIHKVKYSLPYLANNIAEAEEIYWKHGDNHPGYIEHDSYEVEITYRGRTTKAIPRPRIEQRNMGLAEFNSYRHADLLQNIVPRLNSRAAQRIERDFHRKLRSTTLFGAAKTFTNGPLSAPASNQAPYKEFDTFMNDYVLPIAQYEGFEVHLYWSPPVRSAFANHPDYTGRGGGDIDLSRGLNATQITQRFADAHGIPVENIHLCNSITSRNGSGQDVQDGESDNIEFLTKKMFSVQLYPTKKEFDLVDNPGVDKPDGSLCIAMGDDLLPDMMTNEAGKTEEFRTTWGHGIFSPRASEIQLGWHWDGDTIVA